VFNDQFNRLADFAEGLPKEISAGHLHRQAAKVDDDRPSMAFWTAMGKLTRDTIVSAHRRRNPTYMAFVACPERLAVWLERAVTAAATQTFGELDDRQRDIIRRRTHFSAEHWENRECNVGRDTAEIQALDSPSPTDCRRIAQRVTVTERHAMIVETVAKAIVEVTPEGADAYAHRPAIVARAAKLVSKSAAYDVFKEAVLRAAEISATVHRYIVPLPSVTSTDLPSVASPGVGNAGQSDNLDSCFCGRHECRHDSTAEPSGSKAGLERKLQIETAQSGDSRPPAGCGNHVAGRHGEVEAEPVGSVRSASCRPQAAADEECERRPQIQQEGHFDPMGAAVSGDQRHLIASGALDRCGVTSLAGKAVDAPFVGAVAATLA
jgi:hypothetical protein